MNDPTISDYARLPSVDRLLNADAARELITRFGRGETRRVARQTLAERRSSIGQGDRVATDIDSICAAMRKALEQDAGQGMRRVINLSGTILHTNLGRASLPQEAIDAVVEAMRSPVSLEYDIASGRRGDRDGYLESLLCRLTGAEAATVVNNNAAALMLTLNTIALGRSVPVSRGELVEIGGSFRIPDIIERSGCRLHEIGTTNRTHLRDYRDAIGPQTACILKVHQSNYVIEGFTASVDEAELAGLCRDAGIPCIVDLGSGALVDFGQYGLAQEPMPMQVLARGADLVLFSGDKLLGGPQAGIILGCRELVERIDANPMKRALRCDKMTIAALTALLRLYLDPERLRDGLPLLRMLTRDVDEIRAQAALLVPMLEARVGELVTVSIVDCDSEIGSGALPGHGIGSVGIALRPLDASADPDLTLERLSSALRALPVPVVGRLHRGALMLDCRCLEDTEELATLLAQLTIEP